MEIGIIGLPNAGKSTLFKALTGIEVEIAGYTFTTIDSNVGVTEVPDELLLEIGRTVQAEKIVPAHVKFVDIAGLVKNASQGEGLGNQFLGHIRNVDVIVHLVRCFESENISHIEGENNPLRDIEIIELELRLADLETVAKRIDKFTRQAKSGEKDILKKVQFLKEIKILIEQGKQIETTAFDDKNKETFEDLHLLISKPFIMVANISDEDLPEGGECYRQIEKAAAERGQPALYVAAAFEADLTELSFPEKKEFLEEAGLNNSLLVDLIRVSYRKLDLITFYTIESKETRAWSIKKGSSVVEAAGKIHTDMAEGFIKAEIVNCRDLIKDGSFSKARDYGHYKIEGREYIVNDGDVILIKFSK